jgi:taurine dioxygenase
MSPIIRPLSKTLGAEVTGVDLSLDIDDSTFQTLRSTLEERQVLVIRDQHITPEEHIVFSRRFGPLEIHVQHHFHLPGYPEILIVSNIIENGMPIGLADAGHYWHSDLSYLKEPSLASLLHAQELPEVGGDTLFVNMHAAYEALPRRLRSYLDELDAVHDYGARNRIQHSESKLRPALTAEQERRVPPVIHPVVRVHPTTARRALFVNEGFTTHIVGLSDAESAKLLSMLIQHMTEERFIYRHQWRPFDLLIWDNRSTIHLATGCPPQYRRKLYRTTVRGDVPIGPEVEQSTRLATIAVILGF